MLVNYVSDGEFIVEGALEQSISTLITTFNDLIKTSDQEGTQSLELRRDITLRAFASLIERFPRYVGRFKAFSQSNSIANQKLLTNTCDRLKSSLLPCLRHRITSLSLSLDPSDVQKDSSQKLKLILEILLELEQTLDQIGTLFNLEVSENSKDIKDSSPSDAPTKNLTSFKHERLIWKVTDIVEEIHRLLCASRNLIVALDLKNGTPQQSSFQEKDTSVVDSLSSKRTQIINHTTFSWELIDKLNEWLNLSDCSIVQAEWQVMVVLVDDALNELLSLLNTKPSCDQVEPLDLNHDDEDEDYQQKPLNEKMMKIGNLMIPIIKLSRLFLNKISKTKANKEPVMLLSEMNSTQLISLLELTRMISPEIDELMDAFNDQVEEEEMEDVSQESDSTTHSLFPPVERLSECFKSCCLVLFPYLDSLSSTFDDKIHPKTWFETWNHQFILANQKFKDGCTQS